MNESGMLLEAIRLGEQRCEELFEVRLELRRLNRAVSQALRALKHGRVDEARQLLERRGRRKSSSA